MFQNKNKQNKKQMIRLFCKFIRSLKMKKAIKTMTMK